MIAIWTVLSTISNTRRLNPSLLVVGVGMLCFAFSDSAYAYLTAVNAYSGSNLIDVGWVAGYLVIGLCVTGLMRFIDIRIGGAALRKTPA